MITHTMNHEKCLELSKQICEEAVHHYLKALAVKARKISLLSNARKNRKQSLHGIIFWMAQNIIINYLMI